MEIKTKKTLLKFYSACSEDIRDYFEHLPSLIEKYPLEVALAYAFSRLERGQNMALYGCVVKIHKVDVSLAKTALRNQHMNRDGFIKRYKELFGFEIPREAQGSLKKAESTRDAIMHGKKPIQADMRNAIGQVLAYAEAMNAQISAKENFKPFGNMTGFKGRGQALDKRTSRWVLKGMQLGLG